MSPEEYAGIALGGSNIHTARKFPGDQVDGCLTWQTDINAAKSILLRKGFVELSVSL